MRAEVAVVARPRVAAAAVVRVRPVWRCGASKLGRGGALWRAASSSSSPKYLVAERLADEPEEDRERAGRACLRLGGRKVNGDGERWWRGVWDGERTRAAEEWRGARFE